MQGAEDESPVIHSQLHRTVCASGGTIDGRRWPGQRQRPRNGPCNSIGSVQRQNVCRIAASSGLFALNREISNQTIIGR